MAVLNRRNFFGAIAALLTDATNAQQPAPEFLAYERETGGRIGVYAHNLKTDRALAWRQDERFSMCSSFKVSLVACVLQRVDRGDDYLARPVTYGTKDLLDYAPTAKANVSKGSLSVAEMCQAAIELSDNTCANLLLASIGGPPAMTAFWRSIGDPLTRLDHHEPELNVSRPDSPEDTTTPTAMAENLHRLVLGRILYPRRNAYAITADRRVRGGGPQGRPAARLVRLREDLALGII